MKFLREKIRNIKYNLKFFNRNKKTRLNYTVNSSSNSKLTELMNLHGSDKGGKNNHHNYSEYYSEIFFNKRKEIKNFLEIGLGTNNINLPSNMGATGVPLASLRAWKDYFKKADIYGADIDKNILVNENRIKTFFVDQTTEYSFHLFFQIDVLFLPLLMCSPVHQQFSIKIQVHDVAPRVHGDSEHRLKLFLKIYLDLSPMLIQKKNPEVRYCLILQRFHE